MKPSKVEAHFLADTAHSSRAYAGAAVSAPSQSFHSLTGNSPSIVVQDARFSVRNVAFARRIAPAISHPCVFDAHNPLPPFERLAPLTWRSCSITDAISFSPKPFTIADSNRPLAASEVFKWTPQPNASDSA